MSTGPFTTRISHCRILKLLSVGNRFGYGILVVRLLAAIFGYFLLLSVTHAEGFGVEEVVSRIKGEITRAQQEQTGDPRLRIDRVELELAVVANC